MTILTRVKTGPLAQSLQRFARLRRTRGNARVCYAVLRRLVALPLLRHGLHLCAVDLWRLQLPDSWSPPRTSPLFMIRLARTEDLAELAEYFGDRKRIETRLAQGDQCVVAVCQRSIGAAVWMTIGPGQFMEDWNDLRCAFRFRTGVAFAYDGKGTKLGAWGTMMKQLPGFLRDENVREIVTVIDCNNWQSQDAHRSLGYTSAGVLLHARVLGLALRLFKPLERRWRPWPTTELEIERQGVVAVDPER